MDMVEAQMMKNYFDYLPQFGQYSTGYGNRLGMGNGGNPMEFSDGCGFEPGPGNENGREEPTGEGYGHGHLSTLANLQEIQSLAGMY